jgi:hypothetical protein
MEKKNQNSFWQGFQSAFDLYGFGFKRSYRVNNVHASWHNVGLYFSNTFNKYVSLDTDLSEEELRAKIKSQKKRYAHR